VSSDGEPDLIFLAQRFVELELLRPVQVSLQIAIAMALTAPWHASAAADHR